MENAMENKTIIKFNTGKGIILALVGMIAGLALWLVLIALLGAGTGGAVGGVFAAVLGMLSAAGYRKGPGKPGIVGIIPVALLALIGTAAAITLGTAILIYQEGIGQNVFDSWGILFDLLGVDNRVTSAFLQDLIITAAISVVMAVVSMVGGKKKK